MKKIEIEELFDYYYLTEQGEVWSDYSKKYLKIAPTHSYKLKTRNGKLKTYTQKELYKRTFGTVFCNDTTESKEGEIWREIEGTDGKYYVSNIGRVKSLCGYNAIIMKKQIILKGYQAIQLTQNGLTQSRFVHTLVANAFQEDCGKQENTDWEVHHIDGDRTNNNSKNLKWVSPAEHKKIHSEKEKETN